MSLREKYKKIYEDDYHEDRLEVSDEEHQPKRDIDYYLSQEGGEEQLLSEINYILNGDPDLIDDEDDKYDNGGPISFVRLHDALKAIGVKWYKLGRTPTADELKENLKEALFELFEKKCNQISGVWTVGYEIDEEPDPDTPDDFEHRVNLYVRYDLESYYSLWPK